MWAGEGGGVWVWRERRVLGGCVREREVDGRVGEKGGEWGVGGRGWERGRKVGGGWVGGGGSGRVCGEGGEEEGGEEEGGGGVVWCVRVSVRVRVRVSARARECACACACAIVRLELSKKTGTSTTLSMKRKLQNVHGSLHSCTVDTSLCCATEMSTSLPKN